MRKSLLLAAVASSALMVAAPMPASAMAPQASPKVTVLNSGVVMPYSLATSRGRVYVADGATRQVSVLRNGTLHALATAPPGSDVAGLDVSQNGRRLAYTTSNASHSKTSLEILGTFGRRTTVDLAGYEAKFNPDHIKHYGVQNPSACVSKALGPEASYRGRVDSHPYAVASVGRHWFVADAGGNDLLRVSRTGRISTVAVLPRQPLKITAAVVKSLHLPACALGVTYYFESVPTDVEVGPGGWLYVSTLAGGPEDPSLGGRSKVYRVNPRTGKVVLVGSHLLGATNIALRNGKIYVAEFFGGRVSVLVNGRPETYVKLPGVLSLESGRRGLLAGTSAPMGPKGPQGNGKIVRIT